MTEQTVAVVGVGGTGCAVLRLLFRIRKWTHIVLVDPDSVALTDLSRQFFFTRADIGASKVEVLAARLTGHGAKRLTALPRRVQDVFPQLTDVDVFFSCVASLAARVFLNRRLKERGRPFTLIDTGSNKFQGHALRVDEHSACLHCCIELYEGPSLSNACTLRGQPRTFSDCLARCLSALPAPVDASVLQAKAAALAAEASIEPQPLGFTANFLNAFAVNIAAVNELVGCLALHLLRKGPALGVNYASVGLFAGTSVQKLELAPRADCPICHHANQATVELIDGSTVADLARAVPDVTGAERFCLFGQTGELLFTHNAVLPAPSQRALVSEEQFAVCEAGTGRRWTVRARLTPGGH